MKITILLLSFLVFVGWSFSFYLLNLALSSEHTYTCTPRREILNNNTNKLAHCKCSRCSKNMNLWDTNKKFATWTAENALHHFTVSEDQLFWFQCLNATSILIHSVVTFRCISLGYCHCLRLPAISCSLNQPCTVDFGSHHKLSTALQTANQPAPLPGSSFNFASNLFLPSWTSMSWPHRRQHSSCFVHMTGLCAS